MCHFICTNPFALSLFLFSSLSCTYGSLPFCFFCFFGPGSLPASLHLPSPFVDGKHSRLSAQPAGFYWPKWTCLVHVARHFGGFHEIPISLLFVLFLTGRGLQFPPFPDHTATYVLAQLGNDSFHLSSYISLAFDEPHPLIYQPRLAASCTNYRK